MLAVRAADYPAARRRRNQRKPRRRPLARWPHRFEIRARWHWRARFLGRRRRRPRPAPGTGEDAGYYDVAQSIEVGCPNCSSANNRNRPPLLNTLERDPWNSDAARALAVALHRLEGGDRRALLRPQSSANPGNSAAPGGFAGAYCLLATRKHRQRCFRKSKKSPP